MDSKTVDKELLKAFGQLGKKSKSVSNVKVKTKKR